MCSHILKPFTAPSTPDPPGLEEEVRLDERLTEDILWQREREKDERRKGGSDDDHGAGGREG